MEHMSRMYSYVRSLELEGTLTGSLTTGVWPITALRILHGWGAPTEAEWPYDGSPSHWPPTPPTDIDLKAKASRGGIYQRVRSIDECRLAIAQQAVILVNLNFERADWLSAPLGNIALPKAGSPLREAHSVLLIGYDDNSQIFRIRNSWGASWGDQGNGTVPYEYFELHCTEAWVVVPGTVLIPSPSQRKGIVVTEWAIQDLLYPAPLTGVDIFDATSNECVGWAFMVEREGFTDIEEFFVRPQYRNQGFGRKLAQSIQGNSALKRPIRLWIPHADGPKAYQMGPAGVIRRLGLNRRMTIKKWASQVALP